MNQWGREFSYPIIVKGKFMTDLLVEKYRPQTLDDVIIDAPTLTKFKSFELEKTIPHLLFHGSAGLGKTTIAKILAKSITEESLYINASDETSVDVIRNKVKDFCSTMGFTDSYKIVILDEFDGMSENAMRMLRNTMEEFSDKTRFILTCNYVTKVIPAIRSRCQEFEFGQPAKKDIAKRCFKILKDQGILCESDECKQSIMKLVTACYPDIRKTFNNLQKFTVNGVFAFGSDLIDSDDANKFFALMKEGDVKTIRKELLGIGCDYLGLYRVLFDKAKELTANESGILAIMLAASEYMYRHASVPDQEMNFVACLLSVWKIMKSE
jgi:replication factor C small subunit